MKRAMRAGVLAALAGLSGCIVKGVYVGDDAAPCHIDADCVEQGQTEHACEQGVCVPKPTDPTPLDPTWGCLDEGPPVTTNDIVPFELAVATITNVPVTNATVRVCSRLQPLKCESPIGAPAHVDPAGVAHLEVSQDFNGYFEVYGPQGPDVDDPNFVRTLVYFPPRDIVRGGGRRVTRFNQDEVSALTALVGGSFDDETSLLLATAIDCTGEPASDISFDLVTSPSETLQTRSFYLFNGLPTLDATETGASGSFGLTNLNPGPLAISALLNPRQQLVTSSQGTTAFARGGWVTALYVSP